MYRYYFWTIYDLDYISEWSWAFLMMSLNNLKTSIQKYLFQQNSNFSLNGNYHKVVFYLGSNLWMSILNLTLLKKLEFIYWQRLQDQTMILWFIIRDSCMLGKHSTTELHHQFNMTQFIVQNNLFIQKKRFLKKGDEFIFQVMCN